MRKLLVLALALGGCSTPSSGHDHDGGTSPPALQSIDVAPPTVSLTAGGAVAPSQQFTATGHFADGHTEDVTAQVAWSLSDPGIGTIAAGGFTGVEARGGIATVTADDAGVQGTATLTIKYVDQRVSTDDGSTAPANSGTLFGGADDPSLAPTLAYPLDGARLPHNLGTLEVQWKKPTGVADLFEVSFESATVDYKVYTNALQPNGGRLTLSPTEWQSLADSSAGQALAIKVRATLAGAPTQVGSSAVVELSVDHENVTGGIYYFAPVSATGQQIGAIMRHSFGDTSSQATQFYAPNNGARCVGCHVLTRDGTRVAVTFDGGNGPAAELAVPDVTTSVIPESAGDRWNFASFSPDGTRMVATSQGKLVIIDTSGGAANGTVLQTLADGSTGHYASHPDWSPDGSKIVYVSVGAPQGAGEWQFGQGSLVVVSDMGMGTFGPPMDLVKSGGENNYYPSFSPDGKWVLFNRGSGQAYNDPTAQVWVVSSDGKVGPIALGAANAAGNLTNSWPRWSPFVLHEPDGSERLFFTFSSTRDYGIELVGANAPQVWMAAFDPAAAQAGIDPSAASFWMPFQDVRSHNHIAQWTMNFIP